MEKPDPSIYETILRSHPHGQLGTKERAHMKWVCNQYHGINLLNVCHQIFLLTLNVRIAFICIIKIGTYQVMLRVYCNYISWHRVQPRGLWMYDRVQKMTTLMQHDTPVR